MVIIVFGLPGSGKSYFASALANRIAALYLSSDKIRKELFAVRTYKDDEKERVYSEILERTVKGSAKKNVVVDATFCSAYWRDKFKDRVASRHQLKWIEINAAEELVRKRLSKPRPESDADFSIYKKLRDKWEPMNEHHLILESDNENFEEMMSEAIHYLKVTDDSK
jgi:predicted kinase